MRSRLALTLALAALAGCGPTPPQAPKHEAEKIDHSTGVLSSACGEASQISAFGGDPSVLEENAASNALDLAAVYRRNRNWIYQGETVHKIVHDAITLLEECGLHRAGRTLARATR